MNSHHKPIKLLRQAYLIKIGRVSENCNISKYSIYYRVKRDQDVQFPFAKHKQCHLNIQQLENHLTDAI